MAWRAAAAARSLPVARGLHADRDHEAARLRSGSLSADPPGRGQHRGRERRTVPGGHGLHRAAALEQLSQDAQAFLRSRLVAAGGRDFARATVEEASLVERARPTNEGVVASATEPNWEMVGVLALKVAIVDGLGIEQSFASSRVEIKRTISERAGVEAKDNFARTITADLIAASSRGLETSIDQDLADRKAP